MRKSCAPPTSYARVASRYTWQRREAYAMGACLVRALQPVVVMVAVAPIASSDRKRVLIVDDEPTILHSLKELLVDRFDVETCDTAEAAESKLLRFRPDVLLTDVRLPGESGLALVSVARRLIPESVVIVLTGLSSVDVAVQAMKAGAHDFLTKPVDVDVLDVVLDRTLEQQKTALEVKWLRERLFQETGANRPLGDSFEMQEVVRTATEVADSMATILVTGESGSGKEVLARYIHDMSSRAAGPFVAVNCGAIPATLLESEFFGHEAGSFTGAVKRRIGRFERAQSGTIFLDEIGELPLTLQVKLLRTLQEREIERVGDSSTVELDVRVIAATNRDLIRDVEQNRFREDLYYRLNVIHLHLPPLRERKSDIADLWTRFVKRFADREGFPPPTTAADAVDALYAHDWPGNVRELENAAERAVILSHGATIELGYLPRSVCGEHRCGLSELRIPGASMEEIEKAAILKTLAAVDGSTGRCAEILGISVRKIQYRLKAWRREAAGPSPDTHDAWL